MRIRRYNSTLFVNFDPHARKPRKPLKPKSRKQVKIDRQWAKVKKELLAELAGDESFVCCENCGKPYVIEEARALEADHKKPRSKGGEHTKENAALLCVKCHRLGPKAKHK